MAKIQNSLDYYLFPNLVKWHDGKIFGKDEDVEYAVDGYVKELDGSYCKQIIIEDIEHRCLVGYLKN